MKKRFLTAGLLALIAPLASFAAPAEQYHYGQKLDVKQVLSIHEDASPSCGVVNARMDYLDSQGKPHSLAYQKFASACAEGG